MIAQVNNASGTVPVKVSHRCGSPRERLKNEKANNNAPAAAHSHRTRNNRAQK